MPTTKKPTSKKTSTKPEPLPKQLAIPVRDQQILTWFESHTMDEEQKLHAARIREAGAAFAQVIKAATPGCADQSAAIRKVREASDTAVAAIACRGR